LKLLIPVLGPCIFGIPVHYLYWALLWSTEDSFPLQRRSGLGLPSWSWTAWKGFEKEISFTVYEAAHFSTPIQFYVFKDVDPLEKLDQRLLAPFQFTESLNPQLKVHFKAAKFQDLRVEVQKNMSTPYHKYLLFWTSMAYIQVDRQTYGNIPNAFVIRDRPKDLNLVGSQVYLDPFWRANQPDLLPFILIAWSIGSKIMFKYMLIDIVNGISKRVQLVDGAISQDDWMLLGPQKSFIVLG
jgi:hypothetical protein